MSIGASARKAANGLEAHVAWVEANRGTAIDDRAMLAAFMDEHDALLRGAMHAGLATIAERVVMSADAPSRARALVATS